MKVVFEKGRWQIDDVDLDMAKRVVSVPYKEVELPTIDGDDDLDKLVAAIPIYFADQNSANVALAELSAEMTRLEELHTKVLAYATEGLKPVTFALGLLDEEYDWRSERLKENFEHAHLHLDDIWGS